MKNTNLLNNLTYKILALKDLVTADYQKDRLSIGRAKAIAKEYNPQKAGSILVNCREGKYYIVDGQHRGSEFTIVYLTRVKNYI